MARLLLSVVFEGKDGFEKATKMADDIRVAGDINYVDAEGSTVNVEVGDVTVEQ